MSENTNLKNQVSSLLAIFDEKQPIQKDGTFSPELVKETALLMADFVIEEKVSLEALKNWMEGHDFWTSPASTRFHGNVKGGLAAHSLLVAVQALRFAPAFAENFALSKRDGQFPFTAEDVFVSAIAHDFCKAGAYATESRKTKDFNGNWKYEPFYKTKSDLRNLGHGNESVLLLLESMPHLLKRRNVIEAISRHMGFSDLAPMETYNYSNLLQNPLVLLIQLADQSAAQWWDL
ncbi:HD domain-containing protein [uncultured Treponema sp.]|uniref:HD domain-containing protein n=1 Tax=uncultured Treponema sp. TaxID=162155 RepID=UPI0025E042C4|nr:HD domain-containing protein [uncultured Treponema sp.]